MFFLLACSSMDRKTCLSTNWYEKGVEDARDRGEDHFEKYKRECAEERISIFQHSQAYKKGILEGLRSWCTFQNGFNRGLEGHGGTGLCDTINPAYGRGYEEGYREFRLTQRRQRDEEERSRKYKSEQDAYRQRVLSRSNTKECTVDHDCQKDGECRFNRCTHDNKTCTYNYECKVRGWCREVSEMAHSQRVSLRVCDY